MLSLGSNPGSVDEYYDANVMWIDNELQSIIDNEENITPSIQEFMRNLGAQPNVEPEMP